MASSAGHRRIGLLVAALLLTVLLAPGPTARAGGSVPVWYSGDDDPGAADRARLLVQAAMGSEGPAIGEVAPLDQALFGGAHLWPLTSAVRRCAGSTPIKLETALARAERALEEVEFAQAAEALAPIDGQLACVEGAVDAVTLGRAALLLGHVRHLTGDLEGASRAFAQAAVFDPDVVWDGNYSPAAQPVFNGAVLESLRTRDAHVRGGDGSWTLPDVELDGGPVPRYGALRPGLHQLALRTGDGSWVRTAVEFEEGQTLRLATVDTLGGELDDPAVAGAVLAALASAPGSPRWDEVWIVDLSGELLHRHRDGEDTLALVEQPKAGRLPRPVRPIPGGAGPRRGPAAGPALVIGGAVTAAVGLGLGFYHRERALEIYGQVTLHNDQFERYDEEYQTVTQRMTAGYVVAAIGGAALVAGIPTWIVEARRSRRAVTLSATLTPLGGPLDGGAVVIVGRW